MGFTGPNDTLRVFGIALIGVTPENGRKLLLTLIFVALTFLISRLLQLAVGRVVQGEGQPRLRFWTPQGIKILTAVNRHHRRHLDLVR